MAKYAFSLFALFLVYSALDVSYAENALQTLLTDVLQEIEAVNGTLTTDVQNALNIVYTNLETEIAKVTVVYNELVAIRETTSDSTCATSLDSLDAVVDTVAADLTEEYDSFISSWDLTLTELESFGNTIETALTEEKNSLSTSFFNAIIACNITLDF